MSEVTFVPAVDFLGFPEGSGRRGVNFKAGQESIPVSRAFAQLMRDKGLVDEARSPRAPVSIDPPQPAVAKKIAAAASRRPGKTAPYRQSRKG